MAKTLATSRRKVKPPAEGPETMALLERAARSDETCLDELDALLDDPTRGPEIIAAHGDPAELAEAALLHKAAGGDLAALEASARRLAELRAELAGPRPSPIERLLAERAAYCWFDLWRCEAESRMAPSGVTAKVKGSAAARADFYRRRIDAAHRRYLSSLRSLAAVRKLALPSLQVNIGQNQVNVAGEA